MSAHLARADEWTVIIADGMRIFVGRDPLMDDDYATRVDIGVDDRTGWQEIRWGPMPAGGRLQLAPGLAVPRSSQFPQMDTEQFRAQIPEIPGDRLQIIDTARVRRAIAAMDPWADTEGEHRG